MGRKFFHWWKAIYFEYPFKQANQIRLNKEGDIDRLGSDLYFQQDVAACRGTRHIQLKKKIYNLCSKSDWELKYKYETINNYNKNQKKNNENTSERSTLISFITTKKNVNRFFVISFNII